MKVVNQHVAPFSSVTSDRCSTNPVYLAVLSLSGKSALRARFPEQSVKRSEMSGGGSLNSCVIGVIQGMKFPAAANGHSTLATIGFLLVEIKE